MGNLIDFDGFEKYAQPSAATLQGFAKAGANVWQTTTTYVGGTSMLAEGWQLNNVGYATILTGLLGVGKCFSMYGVGSGGAAVVRRFWPANYNRIIFGCSLEFGPTGSGGAQSGIIFLNGGDPQASLLVDSSGHLVVSSGGIGIGYSYVAIWQSTVVLLPYTRYYVEIDITFDPNGGAFSVWLNGVLIGTGMGQTAFHHLSAPLANGFELFCGNPSHPTAWDDMYWRDNQDAGAAPFGDAVVEGLQVIANSSVAFTPVGNLNNYSNVSDVPAPWYESNGSDYNASATIGATDLFQLTPTYERANAIISLKASALSLRSTAGLRTMNLDVKSQGIIGNGSAVNLTPPTGNPIWESSRFDLDPSTNAAWSPDLFFPVNVIEAGYSILS